MSGVTDPLSAAGERSSVGGSGDPLPITGYSMVEAGSMDEARAMCDGHPFLDGAPEDFSVDLYELTPMEM